MFVALVGTGRRTWLELRLCLKDCEGELCEDARLCKEGARRCPVLCFP